MQWLIKFILLMRTLNVFLLAFLMQILCAYNPLIIWSDSDLGKNWQTNTESMEPIGMSKFSDILSEVSKSTVQYTLA